MNDWKSWIKFVPYSEAEGKLKTLYDRIKGPNNNVDNIMLVHSLRPHTLEGHMVLYKNVLHHTSNSLPKWLLEMVGVYVSILNACSYCVEHHFNGLKRLLNDDTRSQKMRLALGLPRESRHHLNQHCATRESDFQRRSRVELLRHGRNAVLLVLEDQKHFQNYFARVPGASFDCGCRH